MGFWIENEIEVGNVVEKSSKKFYFEGMEEIPRIKNIIPGCGCSDYRYDHKTKRLHVVYKADRFPYHIKDRDSVEFVKHFNITYIDGSSEVLTFIGNKIKNF